jgi:hypothetical protein
LVPIDWLPWTAETSKTLDQVATRARKELHAATLEMTLTGRPSPGAAQHMPKAGWTLVAADR